MSLLPDFGTDAIVGVLPVKNLEQVKQRLVPALSPQERRALFGAMLEDVLASFTRVRALTGVVMVTRDAFALELAAAYGAYPLVEEENRGQSSAVALAAGALARRGVPTLVALPGDVPLVQPADITALLDAHAPGHAITIAPARDEYGSNAVVCTPPDLLPLSFGPDSFRKHKQSANDLGVDMSVVNRPALGLDVDTPDDLRTFIEAGSDTRAAAYLASAGIAARLERKDHQRNVS